MAEISLFPSDQLVFVDETEFVCDTQYILHACKYHYKVYTCSTCCRMLLH